MRRAVGEPPRAAAPAVEAAVTAAVHRLLELSHPEGTWTDFWLEPGAATSWVTAYAAHALATAAGSRHLPTSTRVLAGHAAGQAADTLLRTGRDGAWGWTPHVRPDADSTAWVVRTLCATGRPVPEQTWSFLARHRVPSGFRTYTSSAAGAWSAPTPEVTAAVLLALHDGGRLTTEQLAAEWVALFGDRTTWRSHWWSTALHPTAVVRAAWVAARRPEATGHDPREVGGRPADEAAIRAHRSGSAAQARRGHGPGAVAAAVWVAALTGDPPPLSELLALQLTDGGWPGLTALTVPPAHLGHRPRRTRDARGVFTTATAVQALLATGVDGGAHPEGVDVPSPPPRRQPRRAPRDARWDPVVIAAARSQGCDPVLASQAVAELTRESLAARSPWPTEQLSTLAAGLPLELSAGGSKRLRLACEVGDPRLPPHRRVRSGVAALARTASALGVEAAWVSAQAVLDVLVDPQLAVPDGNRFWLWGGLDLHPDRTPVLKAYASLLARDVPGRQEREHAALLAAGVPLGSRVFTVLDRLRADGWCQQIGLASGPHGRSGLKVYYEVPAWRPALVGALLSLSGLPDQVSAVTPDVPGVLRSELAARQRSGVSLRVDTATGSVDELTVTAAFPPPLVGREELDRRVLAWLSRTGSPAQPLAALLAAVEPTWRDAPSLERRLSLFTRSLRRGTGVGPASCATTVYVRPGPSLARASSIPGGSHVRVLVGGR